MQTPFRVRILQSGEVLDPISRVEINAVPMLIHIFPHLRLMDVPTDHILIAILNRQVGGCLFEIVHKSDSRFHAVFDAFRQRYLLAADQAKQVVHEPVDQDQHIVPNGAKPGQPFGVTHGHVEHIAVKDPALVAVQHERFRRDAAQISQKLGGVASVGAQVNIRNDDYVYVAFLHAAK